MAGGFQIQTPSQLNGHLGSILIQSQSGEALRQPLLPYPLEHAAYVTHGTSHVRVSADREGRAGIPFPLLPDRADIDEIDVIFLQHQAGRRGLVKRLECVGSETNLDAVPTTQRLRLEQHSPRPLRTLLLAHAHSDPRGNSSNRLESPVAGKQQHLAVIIPTYYLETGSIAF